MIKRIKEFMKTCPYLSEIDMNINYLGEDAVSSSVENVSVEPIIKTYTDGGTMRQFLFAVALRQSYGENAEANSSAIVLLEQISDWIEGQNNIGLLPTLDGNRSPVSLEIFKTGWLEDKTTGTAKYQLQCRLVYYQE